MKPLNRLLITDLKRMWRQGLAISVLLACGIATFVMSMSSMRSLDKSMAKYYSDYRFGDIFVSLTRAPNHLADRLTEIPGVDRVETRVVRSVILDVPEMAEPASCRLVSISDSPDTMLNGVALLRGRLPNPTGRVEVVASEQFADAHGFQPGDKLDVIMGGRKEQLHIVGVAMSPEFIYVAQPGLLLTDNRRYGILWMHRRQLEAAFNMEGAFNDAVITLQPKASTKDVLFHVDKLTAPFGGAGAYDRSDQPSHHRVADEMHQTSSMAFVTPSIFLAVATFLFNLVLSRMVRQQQEQIATLRAFGFRPHEIGAYYVKLVVILVTAGCILGCLAAIPLSRWIIDLYVRFFRFPVVIYDFATREAIFASLIAFAAALAGSYSAIRRATRLQPAVAMRPEAPTADRDSIVERLGLGVFLSPITRMIARRLETNKRSTAFSVLGMAMGLSVLVLGSFFQDTIGYVTEVQFERAQRQDVTLTFYETTSPHSLHDVAHLPGVTRAEPFRSVPVRLRNGSRDHRLALMGLEEMPELFRVLDDSQQQVSLPPIRGMTISKKLGEILDVGPGDELIVEVLEGKRQTLTANVARTFPDYTNPGAYLNRHELHRLMEEGERLSGAFLSVDPQCLDDLYAEVKQTPIIAGVLDKNAAHKNFVDTVSENTYVMRMVNSVFAGIIAFGVIYNCALIALAERSRDLATLRVMGFTRGEVSHILLGELAIITLLAIPVGLPIGYSFAYFATLALDTETHRFPLVVSRATYAESTMVLLGTAMASALFVRRMLDRLDLIAVLKVKE
ncbi:MAG: FtsX-like permease family protein [Planctomycetales bacterium]|nr:FtsX-like permease family protein [Planctomycetales bacterium]